MIIKEVTERTSVLTEQLIKVWESSVRATHDFLSEDEILRIKEYVPQAINGVENLIIAENEGIICAFMGLENGRLEMLFIAPDERGHGLGRQLITLAVEKYNVTELTVNEQNRSALGFYGHMGFNAYKRTETDEEGGPYPLIYMYI